MGHPSLKVPKRSAGLSPAPSANVDGQLRDMIQSSRLFKSDITSPYYSPQADPWARLLPVRYVRNSMNVTPSKTTSTWLVVVVFIASWIKPIWPIEQALHSSLTIVAFYLLWRHVNRNKVNDLNFFLIVVFLSAHSIAARWLYSNIPYDKWLQTTLGFSLNQHLGWTRNNFDRLVHFLYGFCFTPVIISYVTDKFGKAKRTGFVIAISAIMITSLWYEWFEWLVAITLSANDAEAYNGQQGDMWDAHKDMLMATIGSLVWIKSYRNVPPSHT